jgi:hypothetical protein
MILQIEGCTLRRHLRLLTVFLQWERTYLGGADLDEFRTLPPG